MQRRILLLVSVLFAYLLIFPEGAFADSKEEFLENLANLEIISPKVTGLSPWASMDLADKAVCTANCQGAGTASCSGTTCSAVNRNCAAGERGYAQCGSTTQYCNECPLCGACLDGTPCATSNDCGCPQQGGFCFQHRCSCPV